MDPNETNPLKNGHQHHFFWAILLLEIIITELMMLLAARTKLGSALLGATELTRTMIITAWAIGFSCLLINPIIKKVNLENFDLVEIIDLEKENDNEWINKFSKTKDTKLRTIGVEIFDNERTFE